MTPKPDHAPTADVLHGIARAIRPFITTSLDALGAEGRQRIAQAIEAGGTLRISIEVLPTLQVRLDLIGRDQSAVLITVLSARDLAN